jgi:cytosine/adenosine deaminase-related metal-dependent hydrolase
MTTHDLVLRGGRVVDPHSGLDAVRDVGIDGDVVRAISTEAMEGREVLDARGHVVAPGFIDLHSHCYGIPGQRLQVLDGVTTALELEAGVHPVEAAYRQAAAEGRPVNYGFSTCWAAARLHVLAGVATTGSIHDVIANMNVRDWQREADARQLDRILAILEEDLAAGALGIGILVGYAPRVGPDEYVAVARLAARHGVPTYTHARELVEQDPTTPIDGAEEIVRAAGETGAHMHYCHVNSTSLRHVDRVHAVVERARSGGATVTTEAYPYGTGMTGIGAAFLAPELLHRRDITPYAIQHLASGRRMADAYELNRMRASNPGDWAFVHLLEEDDPEARELLHRALLFPDTAVASDGAEPVWRTSPRDPLLWPLPDDVVAHPRTAGTYGRTLRVLVRETGSLSLMEAIRRCSLVPAEIVTAVAPAMARKGRLEPGADADVVVFDPDTVTDRATYDDTTRPTTGFRHVLVNGRPVVRDGELDVNQLPGRPVRA